MWGVELTVMAVMIGINAVFAAYEIALTSVSLGQLQRLADDHRTGARAALHMKQKVEASLAVVQLGITLVGTIAAAVGGAGAEESLSPVLQAALGVSEGAAEALAIALVVLPLTVVTIIVGELIPKVFALRNAERVCLTLSPFMRGFWFSVRPVVWVLESTVMLVMSWGERRLGKPPAQKRGDLRELQAAAAVARAARLIGAREEGIILGAAGMQARPIRDIMVPAEHITTLDADAPLTDNLITAHLDMHTRFPVVEQRGDPQSIIGYVNFKDIVATLHLNPTAPGFRPIVRLIPSVRSDEGIASCFERLMREHSHIALVRDTDERVVGMITLEDILEMLVGEIEDEYDHLPGHLIESGAGWVAGGGVSLARLKAVTGLDLRAHPDGISARTLSEWVIDGLGRDVRGGEVLERAGVRVVVRKVRRLKVHEAQVSRMEPQELN